MSAPQHSGRAVQALRDAAKADAKVSDEDTVVKNASANTDEKPERPYAELERCFAVLRFQHTLRTFAVIDSL